MLSFLRVWVFERRQLFLCLLYTHTNTKYISEKSDGAYVYVVHVKASHTQSNITQTEHSACTKLEIVAIEKSIFFTNSLDIFRFFFFN